MKEAHMRFIGIIAAIAALILATTVVCHADPVITPALGATVVSYDSGLPSDFELGGTGAASLSPHVSAVAGAWYGLGRTYLRGTAGARITATDVQNENFSIGIGGQYNASSDPDIRPEGWDADGTIGWRPYPEKLPQVVLIAQGAYMFDSKVSYLTLGLRYALRPF
jgi:hypothetical protein